MTIASQTSRISYTGDGATTAFAVPFYFAANSDLVVSVQDLSGNVTTKLLGTNYNLTGATLSAGGTCTFVIAPTTGFIIAIYRVPQITQTTSYNNNDPFPAKSHEQALDKTATIDQYLKTLIDRAILVAPTDTPPMTTLPPAATRALKALTFDSLGNPTASSTVSAASVSSAMVPVVAASTLSIALGLLGVSSAMQPVVSSTTLALARTALGVGIFAPTYATRALAAAATIDSAVQAIVTAGYTTAGDGGDARYVRYTGTTGGGFQSADGAWWKLAGGVVNVRQFGAKGDSTTNDTTAVQGAITAISALGGGTVFVPAGNYSVIGGISIPTNVSVIGEGRDCTVLQAWHTDITVVTMTGNAPRLEHITVFGKGVNNDTGAFGATFPTLVVSCNNGRLVNVVSWGGNIALYITGSDNYFQNIDTQASYGSFNAATIAANWYSRCKFDHAPTGIAVTNAQPFANWAALTAVTAGAVRITNSYAIQCSVSGTTGAVAPTLKNYGVNMTDGTATWVLLAPASYIGFELGTSSGENHFEQCDFTSTGYTQSVNVNMAAPLTNGPSVADFTNCVFSQLVNIFQAQWVRIDGCELGGAINVQPGYTGIAHIQNNMSPGGAITVSISANVNGFIITGNYSASGAITVAAGTSNHYVISNNVGMTVTDGGSGANKSVTGNVA